MVIDLLVTVAFHVFHNLFVDTVTQSIALFEYPNQQDGLCLEWDF